MPNVMKAAFIKKTGAPDAIIFGDLPIPELSQNSVLVKVHVTAVDWIDTYIRSGQHKIPLHFPYILGRDLCGVVEKVGSDVTGFKPGDPVWSITQGVNGNQGGYSEYALVEQQYLYHLPKGVDEKEAAAVLQGGMTACHGLISRAKLHLGETIFVRGGAGSVGSAIIQLTKARNCRVIVSVGSKEKAEWCKALGADVVINYNEEKDVENAVLKAAPGGVNVYWDTSREPDLERAVSVVAPRGRIILMAGAHARPVLPVGDFYHKDLSLLGFSLNNASIQELRGYAEIINKCLEAGKLKGKIAASMPLAKVSEAHTKLETDSKLWGKIVLTV